MLAVEAAEKRGRRIDWTMAWVAWAEIGTDLGLMSTDEVVALAHQRLEDCSDAELPAILAIADGDGADRGLLREKLFELASGEGRDEQTAIRRWRLLLLQDLLDTLTLRLDRQPSDTGRIFETWYDLRYLWFGFDDVSDTPLSIQPESAWMLSLGKISDADLVQEHRSWAEREEALLYPSFQQNPQSA